MRTFFSATVAQSRRIVFYPEMQFRNALHHEACWTIECSQKKCSPTMPYTLTSRHPLQTSRTGIKTLCSKTASKIATLVINYKIPFNLQCFIALKFSQASRWRFKDAKHAHFIKGWLAPRAKGSSHCAITQRLRCNKVQQPTARVPPLACQAISNGTQKVQVLPSN